MSMPCQGWGTRCPHMKHRRQSCHSEVLLVPYAFFLWYEMSGYVTHFKGRSQVLSVDLLVVALTSGNKRLIVV